MGESEIRDVATGPPRAGTAAVGRPVLATAGISKTFNGTTVLRDLAIEVEPGEVRALLGENGSGKSTFIKVLSGFHIPDPGGTVIVDGEPLALGAPTESNEAGLRFVHQKQSVIPEMTAVENMALEGGYTRPGFIDWKAQRELTEELLARLKVTMDLNVPMRECRAVDRSAVAIARALRPSRDPVKLVVLDEPTASLPEAEVDRLFEVVAEFRERDQRPLRVPPTRRDLPIADRLTVLREGRLIGSRASHRRRHTRA